MSCAMEWVTRLPSDWRSTTEQRAWCRVRTSRMVRIVKTSRNTCIFKRLWTGVFNLHHKSVRKPRKVAISYKTRIRVKTQPRSRPLQKRTTRDSRTDRYSISSSISMSRRSEPNMTKSLACWTPRAWRSTLWLRRVREVQTIKRKSKTLPKVRNRQSDCRPAILSSILLYLRLPKIIKQPNSRVRPTQAKTL